MTPKGMSSYGAAAMLDLEQARRPDPGLVAPGWAKVRDRAPCVLVTGPRRLGEEHSMNVASALLLAIGSGTPPVAEKVAHSQGGRTHRAHNGARGTDQHGDDKEGRIQDSQHLGQPHEP